MGRILENVICEIDCAIKCHEKRDNTYTVSVLQMAKEELINRNWIPCSESLPNKATEVIACNEDGVITIGYIKQRIGYFVCEHLPFITVDIVAWKPLPESYKGGAMDSNNNYRATDLGRIKNG